jgi:predicted alpha/beta-fold hydrolase
MAMDAQFRNLSEQTSLSHPSFMPPWFARNGWVMTLYAAWRLNHYRGLAERTSSDEKSDIATEAGSASDHPASIVDHVFQGEGQVPIFGQIASPVPGKSADLRARTHRMGTIIMTYGIVGTLDQQKAVHIFRDKARLTGYTVIGIDWRAHGKTATLSPILTSDGLYEGRDFIQIAAQAKSLGYPSPYWFMGYSLGGQLALWGLHSESLALAENVGLDATDIGGAVVVCPNLDSNRSLDFLEHSLPGRLLERSIARNLQALAYRIHECHPGHLCDEAIARADRIRQFDEELVIHRLGFDSVEEYYAASSPLPWLSDITKPVFMLYAADDPMFHPDIVTDVIAATQHNPLIDLWVTSHGGHVGYYSGSACRREWGDRDPWWAWNRALDWLTANSASLAE